MEHSNAAPNNKLGKPVSGLDLHWPASSLWRTGEPAINKITPNDLKNALIKGITDFKAVPTHFLFLVLFYPLMGLVLYRLSFGYELLPLVYPIIAGMALLGPIAAVGLYELSRQREQGSEPTLLQAFDVIHRPSIGAILKLGVVLLVIFFAWLTLAQMMYAQILGGQLPTSFGEFAQLIMNTERGRQLAVAGNGVGFLFALGVLAISVVSFPMLVDRNVSVESAVRTSIRAVIENPTTMAIWGLLVAAALIIGSIPFFFGLAVVFPILGHATWHLYRMTVSSDEVI